MKTKFSIVLTTCPTTKVANKIAASLVKKKLAACVQISAPVKSVYRWKGRLCTEKEVQLWIKIETKLFKKLVNEICALHPFEVPEIVSISIDQGLESYLEWIRNKE